MENYSNYSSYPDSRDSSPRSRDCDAASWDEPAGPQNQAQQSTQAYKVKLMCSYGGRIQPRPHDNQLAYVGGDTKILSLDRSVRLPALISKLASLLPSEDLCFKYQLPGEDLDALISVTNEEDLDHMLLEYDRLHRASPKPARLRLFLFPASTVSAVTPENPSSTSSADRQWFVDALNSVQIQPSSVSVPVPVPVEAQPPPPPPPPPQQQQQPAPPDFLFGLDNKAPNLVPPPQPALSSDSAADIHRQIQDLHRLHEHAAMQQKYNEIPRVVGGGSYPGEFYSQSFRPPPDKQQQQQQQQGLNPNLNQNPQMQMMQQQQQLPVHIPGSGGYHMPAPGTPLSAPQTDQQQPVYLIQTPGGMFHHQPAAAAAPPMRPVGQPQPFYHHQRMVPEPAAAAIYRDPQQQQQMYGAAPPKVDQQQQQGYAQVGYDSAGRQVYYTTTAAGPTAATYQNAPPVSVSGGGGATTLTQDGKVVMSKANQSSPM